MSDGFSRFGTVSIRSLLPSAFAPFMVELFTAGFFVRTPELVAPVPLVTRRAYLPMDSPQLFPTVFS
jgi:hypothetical protein